MNRGRQQTSSSCSSSSGGGKLTTHTTSSIAPPLESMPTPLPPISSLRTRTSHGSPASLSRQPLDFASISGTGPCFSTSQYQGTSPCPAQSPLTKADQMTVYLQQQQREQQQQQQQPNLPETVQPMHSNEFSKIYNPAANLKWSLSSNAMHSQLPDFPGLQSGLEPLQDIAPSMQNFPPSGTVKSQPASESFEERLELPVSTSMYSTPTPSPTASTSAEAGSRGYGQQGRNLLPVQPGEYPNLPSMTFDSARPIVCPVETCGSRFTHRNSLYRHIRMHKEQEPFKCKTCDYSSFRIDNLKRHVLIHTKQRPVSCDTCGRKLPRSDKRKLHAKVHMNQLIKKEAKMTTSKAPLPSSLASTSSQAAPSTSHSSISDSSFLSTTLPLVVTTASL